MAPKYTRQQLEEMQNIPNRDLKGEVFCITCERYTIQQTCECINYMLHDEYAKTFGLSNG